MRFLKCASICLGLSALIASAYVVKKGDTLSKIAVENETTVSILCKLNKMKKTDKLRVGRKVRVK